MTLRVCDVCGDVDEQPRHVIAHGPDGAPPPDEAIARKVVADRSLDVDTLLSVLDDLRDTTVQLRHHSCCAQTGCPTGTCTIGG